MRSKLTLNADGTVSATKTADLQEVIDISKKMREDRPMRGARYKRNHTHIALIPEIIVEKILAEHGVNFFHKDEVPAFMSIIRTEYPYLMTVPGNPTGAGKTKIYSRP